MDEAITQIREQMGLSRRERRTRIECLVRALWIPTERNGTVSWGTGRIPWEEVKEAWTKNCLCDGENNGETICEKCEGRKNKKVRLTNPPANANGATKKLNERVMVAELGYTGRGSADCDRGPTRGRHHKAQTKCFTKPPAPKGRLAPNAWHNGHKNGTNTRRQGTKKWVGEQTTTSTPKDYTYYANQGQATG